MYRLRQNPYEYNQRLEEANPNHVANYLKRGMTLLINEEVDKLLAEEDFDGNGEFMFLDFTVLDDKGQPRIWQT
jgi:hypothetical protein